jgi:hypothetical protein
MAGDVQGVSAAAASYDLAGVESSCQALGNDTMALAGTRPSPDGQFNSLLTQLTSATEKGVLRCDTGDLAGAATAITDATQVIGQMTLRSEQWSAQ